MKRVLCFPLGATDSPRLKAGPTFMSNEEGTDCNLIVAGDDVKVRASIGSSPVSFLNLLSGQ